MPFPTNFPNDAVSRLISHFDLNNPLNWDSAEAVYDLLGYLLGRVLRTVDAPQALYCPPQEGEVKSGDIAEALRSLRDNPVPEGAQGSFSLPPWLIPVLLDLLRRWLEGTK